MEGKAAIAERFTGNLKNEISIYMTSISKKKKHVYIDKLDDKVNKYNKKYHDVTKMKPADVKSDTYITIVKRLMIRILI